MTTANATGKRKAHAQTAAAQPSGAAETSPRAPAPKRRKATKTVNDDDYCPDVVSDGGSGSDKDITLIDDNDDNDEFIARPQKPKAAKKGGKKARVDVAASNATAMSGPEVEGILRPLVELRKARIVELKLEIQATQLRLQEKDAEARVATARAISNKVHSDLVTAIALAAGQDDDLAQKLQKTLDNSAGASDATVNQLARALEKLAPFAETAQLREKKELLVSQTEIITACKQDGVFPVAGAVADYLNATTPAALETARARRKEAEAGLVQAKERSAESIARITGKKGVIAGLLRLGEFQGAIAANVIDVLKTFVPDLVDPDIDL